MGAWAADHANANRGAEPSKQWDSGASGPVPEGQGALDVASFRIVAKALDPKNPWPADEGWDNTWVEASADSDPQNPWPATGEGLPAARQQRIAVRDVKGRWYGFMTDQCNSTAELRGYGRS